MAICLCDSQDPGPAILLATVTYTTCTASVCRHSRWSRRTRRVLLLHGLSHAVNGNARAPGDLHAARRIGADELACKPDSVHRAPCGIPAGGHPSRPAVAGRLQRPTRRHRAGHPRSPAQRAVSGAPFGLAPGGVYRAVPVTRDAGGLLHHRFTLTPLARGGLFSVALSRGSPRVAVSNHPALRSPDFPRQARYRARRDRPANSSAPSA
jgi:hypothetical protein